MKTIPQLTLLAAAAAMTACDSTPQTNGIIPIAESGDVAVFVTTASRSYDFVRTYLNFEASSAENVVTIDPAARYQTMDGFGAAITGSAAYNLMQMQAADRTAFLKETFSPTEGMGYSYIRIAIGCSDFSLSEYTCWDNREAGFGLTSEETDYVIPILKEILAINPDVKILGSPWTCPLWMKNSDSDGDGNAWNGGTLKPEFYADYANYFVRWLQAFKNEGISIYSVTPQNEPLNAGNSASTYMGWQQQRDFVNGFLAPAVKPLGVKIYLFDHNYNYDNKGEENEYPAKIYAEGVDNEVVVGAAYHNYGGNRSELNNIHEKYPNKELIFTETSIGTWNDGRNLNVRLMEDMREVALGTVKNWCRGVIVWNLMLDSEMGPNRPHGGCQTCFGAVDIVKSNYKTIRKNSHYYIIGHLSSVVKPDAVRIGAGGYTAQGIMYSAFENADGSYAFVVMNENNTPSQLSVKAGGKSFQLTLPAKSVVSCRW